MRNEQMEFQKKLVEDVERELRSIDDIAHDESIEKAIEELHSEFYIKRFSFSNFGTLEEIILEYKERVSHPHEIIYRFANDEFTFKFIGSSNIDEIRLDYSEEFMEIISEEFIDKIKRMK